MNRKDVALTSVLALSVLATAGCAPTSSHEATSSPEERITLNYWTHVNEPSQIVEQKLIDAYEAEHTNVTINYLPVDFGSLPAKLNSAIAGGGGPDIFNYFQSYAPGLASKGYLAPVDFAAFGVADQAEFNARYTEAIAAGYSDADGNAIGIPHEVSTYQFWINNDHFAAAGLDPVADYPSTWEEVATVAAALQAAPGGPKEGIALSLNNPVRDTLILDAMARQAGQGLFSEDGLTAYVDSPEAIRALQTLGDFANVQKVNNPSLGPTASTNAEDLFGAGTAGMVNVGGAWFAPTLASTYPDISYTVGQYPTFGLNEIGANLYGFGLYVPVTSAHQAEAWKFARYLADNADAYFEGAGVWLGDNETLSGDATASVKNWDVFSEGFNRGYFLPPLVNYNEISQALENAIQRTVVNGMPADESLAQARAEIEPLLAK